MENNKVKVKIFGQEYVISGERAREEIVQVAAHVDTKMQEIADAARGSSFITANLGVLAAVNIASDFFQALEALDEQRRLNIQLEKDAQHYVQLWDESKKVYHEYKEETQAVVLQRDELLDRIRLQEEENKDLKAAVEAARLQTQTNMDAVVREVEQKCRELENSFFDLQMENLQLKKELERYRNNG